MGSDTAGVSGAPRSVMPGLLLVALVGSVGNSVVCLSGLSIADPLVVCLLVGIACRTMVGQREVFARGITLAPAILLPIGIIFYALRNLNFMSLSQTQPMTTMLVVQVIVAFFVIILMLGKLLGQRRQISFLLAVGSAVCGASAIAITAPAVDAESDDISVSLLSVTVVAFFGLFILFPFLAILMKFTGEQFSLFAGSLLQFTGFVKAAVSKTPLLDTTTSVSVERMTTLALSFKAEKYLALVLAIPVLSSMARGKLYIPPVLVLFLVSGVAGTAFYLLNPALYTDKFIPLIKPVYTVSWSFAMAAIGMNADMRELFSNNGAKALAMAFAGFFAAIIAFLVGIHVIS